MGSEGRRVQREGGIRREGGMIDWREGQTDRRDMFFVNGEFDERGKNDRMWAREGRG